MRDEADDLFYAGVASFIRKPASVGSLEEMLFLHINRARYLRDYLIEIAFSDGRKGIANLLHAIDAPVFQALSNKALFAQLKIDDDLKTIVWPNGADVAPEYLYFLAFHNDPTLAEQFNRWGYAR